LATEPTTRAQASKLSGSMGPPPPPPPLLVELPPPVPLVDEPPPLVTVAVEGITVAWAEPIFVESATDTAVIVTVAGVGTVTGAV
jgi:hypothetical protein